MSADRRAAPGDLRPGLGAGSVGTSHPSLYHASGLPALSGMVWFRQVSRLARRLAGRLAMATIAAVTAACFGLFAAPSASAGL
jgi:hypothetical protein